MCFLKIDAMYVQVRCVQFNRIEGGKSREIRQ